ncbi:RiPP maturation radical SAM protein 1 [Actinomadura sp. NAK00032]|uniref:RiPP maturation radical SAM C-methyltransferase n=1 Tax=Actinomadura sp. NAK00032 TaxID=2742128 RepID=UPI00159107CA|nr:RiPP maturation radical SAM C-methyltransferase [Actinomadura sp. NAK00032]QKW35606.1 RiPP maturation radical SAM protein 1 [Actinomadura sp. NAK00032]
MRIALINMPFADYDRPSVALSQLAAHTAREFGAAVQIDIRYVNIDFALLFGAGEYKLFANEYDHLTTGIGEWLFRSLAFPDFPDNAGRYFQRYFAGDRSAEFRAKLLRIRSRLAAFCARTIEEYRLAEADIVGFTSMFSQNLPNIAMARLIKERAPEVITVMGGANCESPMGTVLAEHVTSLDYVFSGPALHTFPQFVKCVLEGEPERADAIPGVISRRNAAQPRFGGAIGRDRDIDDYVRPEYESFVDKFTAAQDELRRGAGKAEPTLYFETSRGCWWGERSHCTFCGLNGMGMGYRAMAPEKAVEQFRWLFSFAPWCTTFAGTDNIMPRNYVRDVFPRLDPPPGAELFYEVKVPVADRDFRTMAQAGVTVVQPGIEALATSTLKLMAKGTTSFLNLQFLQKCLKYGVEPIWNLLLGFPGEEEGVYRKYADEMPKLVHLPPPDGAFLVRFDRYSPYFTKREEYGLDLHPLDFYRLCYPAVPEDRLFELAYFFVDENLAPYQVQSVEWLAELQRLSTAWQDSWKNGERPRLALLAGGAGSPGVLDTRFGDRRWIPVEPDEEDMLRRLASPKRPEKFAAELDVPVERVRAALARFTEHGLLFEESGGYISLVAVDAEDEPEPEPPAGAPHRVLLDLTPVPSRPAS